MNELEQLYNLINLFKENGYDFELMKENISEYCGDIDKVTIVDIIDTLEQERSYWE